MTVLYGNPEHDVRTLERALREGKLTRKDLEKYLKSLPDDKEKGEPVTVEDTPARTPRPKAPPAPPVHTAQQATEGPTFSV